VERVRWRRTRRVMEITGALLTLLLAYFFVTIAISVELPRRTAAGHQARIPCPEIEKEAGARARRQASPRANIGTVPASYDPLRAAFFVSWDANSLAS